MDELGMRKLTATVEYVQRVVETADGEVAALTAKRDRALAEVDIYNAQIAVAEQAAQDARDRLAAAERERDEAAAVMAGSPPPDHSAAAGGAANDATIVVENGPTGS